MKIGDTILEFDVLESTNKSMRELIQEEAVDGGTVVRTAYQTNGRGQRGTTWDSPAANNLLFSVYLDSVSIKPERQFSISQGISLALFDAIKELVGDAHLKIKWPNDILLEGKKCCGLLIESSIKGSKLEWTVAGIGLNVNQNNFEGLEMATSLGEFCQQSFDLKEVLNHCLIKLNEYWNRILSGESLNELYLSRLYGFSTSVPVEIEGLNTEIAIKGIDDFGRLLADLEGEERRFDLKEIRFNPILL